MGFFGRQGRRTALLAAVAVAAGAVFTSKVSAQEYDTASVPFIVNVDATVSATDGVTQRQISVTANQEATLRIPLQKTDGVLFFGTQRRANALSLISNRNGKVTVNLPAQSYKNAEILLYTVNGKRLFRSNAPASSMAHNITLPNLATGVYLLSVRGTDGNALTSRLTHNGAGLIINVNFGGDGVSAGRRLAKGAAAAEWAITVSAEGYVDSAYTLRPVAGVNATQEITLRAVSSGGVDDSTTFIDVRDGKKYKTVKIGEQTWMAQNLNYKPELGNSWCYSNADSNCVKYGRLYDWATAMGIDASYNLNTWGESDVNHQGVCPNGWHLPSRQEWGNLAIAAGGEGVYGNEGDVAGKKLKSTVGWNDDGNGIDEYGFSALPGGYIGNVGEPFKSIGDLGLWWTSTENDVYTENAYYRDMYYGHDDVSELSNYKGSGRSVRCVEDM